MRKLQIRTTLQLLVIAVFFTVCFVTLMWNTSHRQRPTGRATSFLSSGYVGQFTAVESGSQMQNKSHSEAPFHPFVPGQPKAVVILTYMRSGSSFLGQIFNTNPDAFYMFEPLDALYSAMYGLENSWNIPSDVTNFWNGSARILPKEELDAVSSFLHDIFTCSVDSWPTEVLVHASWTWIGNLLPSKGDYPDCVRKHVQNAKCCHKHTIGFCGERLGRWPERTGECKRLLADKLYRDNYPHRNVTMSFEMFITCKQTLRSMLNEKCVNLLKSNCGGRNLRAVKVVRGTMESMEELLRTLPNARVIHLIRDPRAVLLSRKKFGASGDAHFSSELGEDSMIVEGKYHCRTLARDIRTKEQLSVKFPGRIYTVIYEDVVRDLLEATRNIYRFIDEPVHNNTLEWIRNSTSMNGPRIASKWKYDLSAHQSEEIARHCSGVYNFPSLTSDRGTL